MYCMIQNSFGEAHFFLITSHKNSDLVMDTRKEYTGSVGEASPNSQV
jgi:hypothetical protein